MQGWFGLRLSMETFTTQPRYFHPVCLGWIKAFLIRMRTQPFIEDVSHFRPEWKLHRNYLTVFFSVGDRFPRCNRFSDLLFSYNEETQGYLNLEELFIWHLSFKVTALLKLVCTRLLVVAFCENMVIKKGWYTVKSSCSKSETIHK